MKPWEKLYSWFALLFAICLVAGLFLFPQLKELRVLLPASFIGLIINVILMFIVFKDILARQFPRPEQKYIWLALILFFWPAILYYLPKHGFKPRTQH